MNTEQITDRIQQLALERDALDKFHRQMVEDNQSQNQQFQQQVVKNQTRFAQITGAITELQQLIKGENNEPTHPNREHATLAGNSHQLPGDDRNPGSDLRTLVGNRKLDQPDSASR